jgi:ankyrin repeat protein
MRGRETKLDIIVKCVTSSDLETLQTLLSDTLPFVRQFPLCGKWRKTITLMHLAAAYGSITSAQFLQGKGDINAQTDDGVSNPLIGLLSHAVQQIVMPHLQNSFLKMAPIQILLMMEFFFCLLRPIDIFETPLHLAALSGSSDVIVSLLDAGVDANAKTNVISDFKPLIPP